MIHILQLTELGHCVDGFVVMLLQKMS